MKGRAWSHRDTGPDGKQEFETGGASRDLHWKWLPRPSNNQYTSYVRSAKASVDAVDCEIRVGSQRTPTRSFNRDAEEVAGVQLAIKIGLKPAISGDDRVPWVPTSKQCNVGYALVSGVR